MIGALGLSYVLPLRWTEADDAALPDLTAYLRWMSSNAEVIVVDASSPALWDGHHAAWSGFARHLRPARGLRTANGKVAGVLTGVDAASHERVVIADDDVRYDAAALERTARLLDRVDVVRPQNVFEPMPWHARWDTARSLLNRAVGADYPGTLGIRRSTFVRMGGYDGDVLFENLELMRTVRAAGGRIASPLDLYVARRPPSVSRFWSQRVRQAYDDLAEPWRLVGFLLVAPAVATALARRRRAEVAVATFALVGVAEVGRRRSGGADRFPASCSWFAPVWILERGVCAWLAVGSRLLLGGVRYGDGRITVAAHSRRALRRRFAAQPASAGRDASSEAEQLPA